MENNNNELNTTNYSKGENQNPRYQSWIFKIAKLFLALVLTYITWHIIVQLHDYIIFSSYPKEFFNSFPETLGFAVDAVIESIFILFFTLISYILLLFWKEIVKSFRLTLIVIISIAVIVGINSTYNDYIYFKQQFKLFNQNEADHNERITEQYKKETEHVVKNAMNLDQQQSLFIPEIKVNFIFNNPPGVPGIYYLDMTNITRVDLVDIPNLLNSYMTNYYDKGDKGSPQYSLYPRVTISLYDSESSAQNDIEKSSNTFTKTNISGNNVYFGKGSFTEFKWPSNKYTVDIIGVDNEPELVKQYLQKYPSSLK